MEETRKELLELYFKYKDYNFVEKYKNLSSKNTSNKYSKGWGFYAGLYEPSFVLEALVTNASIGKEVLNTNKGYEYKYFFDENGKVIMSERGDKELNFYFYSNKCLEYVFCDKENKLHKISKTFYDENGKITKHIETDNIYNGLSDTFRFEKQIFNYEKEITYIDIYTFIPAIKINNIYLNDDNLNRFTQNRIKFRKYKIIDNIIYSLDDNNVVKSYWPIRFKIVDGKKMNVPLPKKVPIFKIIENNMKKILTDWKNIDKSVIWINCESLNLSMQYTTIKENIEEKWNIAFYDDNEFFIFDNNEHLQIFEDLLFNNECNIDDLIDESPYFVEKMVKIIKKLRKENYIADNCVIILSALEISDMTIKIAKKINDKQQILDFLNLL